MKHKRNLNLPLALLHRLHLENILSFPLLKVVVFAVACIERRRLSFLSLIFLQFRFRSSLLSETNVQTTYTAPISAPHLENRARERNQKLMSNVDHKELDQIIGHSLFTI